MPKITIDGREVEVPEGTRIIEAADRLGIDIPRFCYHPGLSVAGNCRMCLVETNRSAKPVPSCWETCTDGLVVQTRTPRVIDARRSVLEFILLNHPVDCPICDQAGECDLQDLYFAHDAKPSRHAFRKQHKAKARVLGPHIVYDAERCINCTRCVRVCDEVAKAPQLRQVQRGERTFIDTFPDRPLDHAYSMCTADVCPVGALTTRDFRFKCRSWFLRGVDTVCAECARGCAVRVDTYRGAIQRVLPREDRAVNGFWACDAGRLAFHRFEAGRLAVARERGTEVARELAWRALRDGVASAVARGGRIGALLSPFLTCEDAAAAIAWIRAVDPQARFAIGGRSPGADDGILVRADRNPNREGVTRALAAAGGQAIGVRELIDAGSEALVVFGDEHPDAHAIAAAMGAASFSAVFATFDGPLAAAANVALPVPSPYESDGTFVNSDGVERALRAAVPAPADACSVRSIVKTLSGKEE